MKHFFERFVNKKVKKFRGAPKNNVNGFGVSNGTWAELSPVMHKFYITPLVKALIKSF